MNRAIKYRIYPTKSQEELLQKTFGCCRKIWNLMLTDKINYYKETQKTLQTTPAQYKEEYDYLKEVDSLALASISSSTDSVNILVNSFPLDLITSSCVIEEIICFIPL